MSTIELTFSGILLSLIALPLIAKVFAETLDWLFSKIRLRKSDTGAGQPARLES